VWERNVVYTDGSGDASGCLAVQTYTMITLCLELETAENLFAPRADQLSALYQLQNRGSSHTSKPVLGERIWGG